MVAATIPLFLKPGWELGEGADADPESLRNLGVELKNRLDRAGDIVDGLHGRGWNASIGMYDVWATKDCSWEESMGDFEALGLDQVALCLEEIDAHPAPADSSTQSTTNAGGGRSS